MNKKNLIILAGNSKNNIPWIKKMDKVYIKNYNVVCNYYEHWKNDSDIDFNVELNNLEKICKETKEYSLVAKSVGTVLTLIAIEKHIIKPNSIVLMGIPLKYLQTTNINIKKLLNNAINKTKILIIQQKNDPMGKYEEVIKILPANTKTVEIPGNHHVYANIYSIKNLVDNFIN